MNLVIDIGNTRTKMALFKAGELVDMLALPHNSRKDFSQYLEQKPGVKACIISSVTQVPKWLLRKIKKSGVDPIYLDQHTPLPFRNNYLSKESLGYDRIASIAGACRLFPGKDVLVIDAGTAITYDLLTRQGEYIGGNISPGLSMRFRALNHFTSRLPLLEPGDTICLLGRNTEEAILNGVQNGIKFEMDSYARQLSNNYSELIVLLTGGDAHFFENLLKKSIFVDSNLTLKGLNNILEYNAKIK
jgi:type III pantothenate kinase